MREHDQFHDREHCHRFEILFGVVGQLGEHRRHRKLDVACRGEGVAVGRRARHRFHRDVAVGAAAVVDHDLLTVEPAGEKWPHLARDQVAAGAGRIRHDEADRAAGPVLLGEDGVGGKDAAQRERRAGKGAQFHRNSSCVPAAAFLYRFPRGRALSPGIPGDGEGGAVQPQAALRNFDAGIRPASVIARPMRAISSDESFISGGRTAAQRSLPINTSASFMRLCMFTFGSA